MMLNIFSHMLMADLYIFIMFFYWKLCLAIFMKDTKMTMSLSMLNKYV